MRPRGMKVIRMARVDKETSAPIRKSLAESTLRYLLPSFRPLLNFPPDRTNNSQIVEQIDHLFSSRLQRKKRRKKEKTKKERKNNLQIVPRDSSK